MITGGHFWVVIYTGILAMGFMGFTGVDSGLRKAMMPKPATAAADIQITPDAKDLHGNQ